MKLKVQKRLGGFTIIEVIIVLAVAALIMLVVFLAVPALQRGSRNNARKTDVGRISASTVDFISNNGNTLPTTVAHCGTLIGNIGTMGQVPNPTLSGGNCPGANVVAGNTVPASNGFYIQVPTANLTWGGTAPAAANMAILVDYSQCGSGTGNAVASTTYSSGSTNAALVYTVEGGGANSWACVNVQ